MHNVATTTTANHQSSPFLLRGTVTFSENKPLNRQFVRDFAVGQQKAPDIPISTLAGATNMLTIVKVNPA